MVVALLALFVALSGTAIAAHLVSGDKLIALRSLSGNRLRNGTMTGKQINLSKLGTVPTASHAGSADTATSANSANTANTANSANTAGGAPPTGAAGGALAGTYPNPSLAPAQAPQTIALLHSWVAFDAPHTPTYYVDPYGVVHFAGAMKSGVIDGATNAFTMPAGTRPGHNVFEPVVTTDGSHAFTIGWIDFDAGGSVIVESGNNAFVSLDGLSYRTG
jgi:hypothetical protein